jgi:hypothetical protein
MKNPILKSLLVYLSIGKALYLLASLLTLNVIRIIAILLWMRFGFVSKTKVGVVQ